MECVYATSVETDSKNLDGSEHGFHIRENVRKMQGLTTNDMYDNGCVETEV